MGNIIIPGQNAPNTTVRPDGSIQQQVDLGQVIAQIASQITVQGFRELIKPYETRINELEAQIKALKEEREIDDA